MKTKQDETRQDNNNNIKILRGFNYSLLSSLVTFGILGITPLRPSVKAERICVCVSVYLCMI